MDQNKTQDKIHMNNENSINECTYSIPDSRDCNGNGGFAFDSVDATVRVAVTDFVACGTDAIRGDFISS